MFKRVMLVFLIAFAVALFVRNRLPPETEPEPVCDGTWYRAQLTNFHSYPEPGSEECLAFNGCAWAGQFYGLPGRVQSEDWVEAHDIVAVHEKDWDWLGMSTLRLRQNGRQITVQVLDACRDADCDGCCTQNLGDEDHLIDIEFYTMERFGSGSGLVEFQICE